MVRNASELDNAPSLRLVLCFVTSRRHPEWEPEGSPSAAGLLRIVGAFVIWLGRMKGRLLRIFSHKTIVVC
jgi:hypothetical protein